MAGNTVVIMRLLASAYSVAEKAGSIVRKVLHSGELGIVEKTGVNDLQTLADRLAQKSICASLLKSFPKITIIGEEDLPAEAAEDDLIETGQYDGILQKQCPAEYSKLKEEELVVWVDPLDGTKEYTEAAHILNRPVVCVNWLEAHRSPTRLLDHVTVLIGIAYKGKAIAGVINQPFYNYQIIQLVEGKASAYVFASPGCKKWDTCATEAILHAVGGKLTDMHGNAYRYDADVKHMNSAGVLAALRDHQFYASRVPQSVLKALQSD
ncbi:3'(2'),5'-bisphosphate nucleotidase 1 isoform X3 [Neoarius graeffei]|uniref:3'(2'),5'-bisphosphate nucleotidase 1 isoform X3 n=1 Tax=Neoarius graeffei TaxID=443677 RepID=UPI00298C463A|nr:3'(2'),5'-bisphosphate nucleotidase 1 isoform X3 [Neoarius graeffei]